MKRKTNLLILLLAFLVPMITPECVHAQNSVSNIGTTTDTAFGNSTKTQTVYLGTADNGITVQYNLHHVTDTVTGYASLWGSVDGANYAPYPAMDSVAITATGDINKLWFVNTAYVKNPIKYLQVRTRCVSNTTNATSKATVKSKVLPYK